MIDRRPADRPLPRSPEPPRRRHRRRELPYADLDRLDHTRGLWTDEPEPRASDDLHDAVRAAVEGALTEKQREVVEAYFFEGLSQGEIARRLGVTQQVVQKRLYGTLRGGRLIGGAIPRLRGALAPWISTQAGARPLESP